MKNEKLKLFAWNFPFIFILYNSSFKCKYKSVLLICRITCLISTLKAHSYLNGKCSSQGCQWLTTQVKDPTDLPYICSKAHWAPTYHGYTLSLGSRHCENCKLMEPWQTVDTDGAHITSAHVPAPLSCQTSLRKQRFNDKITKNLKIETVEH